MILRLDSRTFRHHSTLVPGSDPIYPNIGKTLLLRMSSIKHMDNGKPATATTDHLFDGARYGVQILPQGVFQGRTPQGI
jgi:hypothetical protein